MNHIESLDNEIFELLDQQEAENDLTNCLVRNGEVLVLFSEKWWINCGNRGKVNREKRNTD